MSFDLEIGDMSPWNHFIGIIFVDMITLRSFTRESIKVGVKDLSISFKILSRPAMEIATIQL